jgi:hypothetical protein
VRRFVDNERVVYPHKRSWLKRVLLLLALAASACAAYHFHYFDSLLERAPVAPPAPPATPPIAAAVTTPEPPEPLVAEPAAPEPMQAAPAPELSGREQRRAARAAIIAERWRERRAARRSRESEPSTSDEREETSVSGNSHSYASAHDDYVSQQHAAAQSGVLRINSLPWSQVYIDGELVGHTPQTNLLLPTGQHQVTLINSEMQLSKTLTVQISAGNIVTRKVNLGQ